MSVYQWLTILGIPSLLAGLFGFIRMQQAQNRAINLAVGHAAGPAPAGL